LSQFCARFGYVPVAVQPAVVRAVEGVAVVWSGT